jgi:hypothetical protein
VWWSSGDFNENPSKYRANYECQKDIHWHEPSTTPPHQSKIAQKLVAEMPEDE